MTLRLTNRVFFIAKTTIIEVFCVCVEPIDTYVSGSTRTWWQKTTSRQTVTHRGTTTVTLAVHNIYYAPRLMIMI